MSIFRWLGLRRNRARPCDMNFTRSKPHAREGAEGPRRTWLSIPAPVAETKRWDAARFAAVAAALQRRGLTIAIDMRAG